MARAAVIGDEQVGGVKQHQQFTNAAGVAGEVHAEVAGRLGLQVTGQLGVVAQANQAHGISGLAQAPRHTGIVLCGPGALRQYAATCIQKHNFAVAHHRVIGHYFLPVRGQFFGFKIHDQVRVCRRVTDRGCLVAWHAAAVQRIHQRQKLFADVLVGVVGNCAVDVAAAVQAFLRVGGKPHTQRRTHQKRHQAADAREQLAVDHRIQRQAAHGNRDTPDVAQQAKPRAVVQRMQMLWFRQAQQHGNFLIFLELQHMQRHTGVALAQLGKHRASQHDAAHLGQQHHQNVARRPYLCTGLAPTG